MDLERTKKLITKHESKEPHAYRDSRNILTIGVGRNIQKGSGPGLRESEIELMLENDLREAIAELTRFVPAFSGLDDVRQAVLVDMRHNLGLAGFLGFKEMLKAVEAHDYRLAASEMIRSAWALQLRAKKDEVSRPQRLARMMDSGQWPDQH